MRCGSRRMNHPASHLARLEKRAARTPIPEIQGAGDRFRSPLPHGSFRPGALELGACQNQNWLPIEKAVRGIGPLLLREGIDGNLDNFSNSDIPIKVQ